jgi:hypothetical protein
VVELARDNLEHDVVRQQLALRHDLLRLPSNLGAAREM